LDSHDHDEDLVTMDLHVGDVTIKSRDNDENVDVTESHVNNEDIATIKYHEECIKDVEGVEVLYEGAKPREKEPDVLDIASDSDDEVCEDIVTVADDITEQSKDQSDNTKKDPSVAKKSADMIIHFFKKATDTEDEEISENSTTSEEVIEQVNEGTTTKRSVEDDGIAAGYNSSKYFNKKQKVLKVPTENDSSFCEIVEVEDSGSNADYRHVGRYYSNLEDQDTLEEEEDETIPACIDVETESPTNDLPKTTVDKPVTPHKSSSPKSYHTEPDTLDESSDNDSDTNEDPLEYLSQPARQDLERLDEIRQWEKTGLGNSMKTGARRLESGDVPLRILSYSVLSQKMLEGRPQLGRGKSKTWLDWEYRWWGIRREVLTLDPDIVCLQEVQFKQPNHFQSTFLPFFERFGYGSASKCKTGDNVDGCAIFYKTDKFSLEKEVGVDFYRSNVDVLEKINVGLICRLVPLTGARGSRTRLVIATTQLHRSQVRTDVRLAQVALLLAELDRQSVKANGQYHPTVMAGNLNLLPFSTVYQLITEGNLKYEGLVLGQKTMPRELMPDDVGLAGDCRWKAVLEDRDEPPQGRLSHRFGFRSVYKHKEARKSQGGTSVRPKTDKHLGEVTAFQEGDLPHLDKLNNVDYVFYNTVPSYFEGQGRVEGALKLLARFSLPIEEDMVSLGGMPSRICPSDHLPLAADFILKT